MNVQKRWFADLSSEEIEGIRRKHEIVVVVDLWAATTNIVLMLGKKPKRLILINDQKYAKAKEIYPDGVLIGQSKSIPEKKFASASNNSADVDQVDVLGKVVLYISFNGARILETFADGEKGWVFTGSLTNYWELIGYLRARNSPKVNIIAAGDLTDELGGAKPMEDWFGSKIFEKAILGEKFDFEFGTQQIKKQLLIQGGYDLENAQNKIWPYIFGSQVDILPTAFINNQGFVEVLRLRSG
jgi:phosphosulfolactate phosphohydrolase-like enzyme